MNKIAITIFVALFVVILGVIYFIQINKNESPFHSPLRRALELDRTRALEKMKTLEITSSAFSHNGTIPKKYTCDGANVNPSLQIKDIPANAKSLVLIVDDPDAQIGTFVHWVVWNIPVTETMGENNVPGTEGMNDFRKSFYGGPCPSSGTHRYFFKVYALDTELNLNKDSRKADVEKAMKSHILAKGELVGIYKRG